MPKIAMLSKLQVSVCHAELPEPSNAKHAPKAKIKVMMQPHLQQQQ
jgi:hypothetical protein